MNEKRSPIILEKIEQLDYDYGGEGEEREVEKAENNFELKKWGANVWSDARELNKDFTMSNLSDQMFNSKVIKFVMNRVEIEKMLRNVFKYAERKITNSEYEITEDVKRRIIFETLAFRRTKGILMIKVHTILNLSKARGGMVLKSFLEGGLGKEEMEVIAGEEGPAIGEPIKRTAWERLSGRNKGKPGMK